MTSDHVNKYKTYMDFWKSIAYADRKQMTGTKKFVGEGRSGFIQGDDGEDNYFKVKSFRQKPCDLVTDIRVRFYVQPPASYHLALTAP